MDTLLKNDIYIYIYIYLLYKALLYPCRFTKPNIRIQTFLNNSIHAGQYFLSAHQVNTGYSF